MTKTLEELYEEFKKLPDHDRYPMPEVFYEHFKVKKPQPLNVNECITYQPPPHELVGKVETRGPVEGGIRKVETLELPVEVKMIEDDTSSKPTLDINTPIPDPK